MSGPLANPMLERGAEALALMQLALERYDRAVEKEPDAKHSRSCQCKFCFHVDEMRALLTRPGLRWGAQGEQGLHGERGCGPGCAYCTYERESPLWDRVAELRRSDSTARTLHRIMEGDFLVGPL